LLALRALARRDRRVRYLSFSRNFGKECAMTAGIDHAEGDAIIPIDVDLQDPPELIEQMVKLWREDGVDVVYGTRVRRDGESALKKLTAALFYRLMSRISPLRIPENTGDFRLMDRRVVDAINSMPESHRFLRGLRAWVGFKQVGVPYVRPERMFGKTTNSFLKNLAWARRAIVSFSYAPLDLITGLALIVVAASFLTMLVQLVLRIVDPSAAPEGVTTLIVLILFLGGIQLLCLAIIGSYLGHMYGEVKGRPAFVVESILNAPEGVDPGGRDARDQPAAAAAVQPRQSSPPSPRSET
jgi:dolichol-phosphate mannosyltransferase